LSWIDVNKGVDKDVNNKDPAETKRLEFLFENASRLNVVLSRYAFRPTKWRASCVVAYTLRELSLTYSVS
jgi:hypothetical protein